MTCTVAIMQPTYLPYLGYLDLIARSDVFVFLDDVQFERRSWQTRNRILTASGERMLSVPVKKQPLQTLLLDMEIDEGSAWRETHLGAIAEAYRGRPRFDEGWAFVSAALERKAGDRLCDLNCALIEAAVRRLGLTAQLLRASALGCGGRRSDHLLEICRVLGADTYLSPRGSADYIAADGVFEREGLPVRYRSYAPVAYPQGSPEFAPYMAFVDALMNLGWDGLTRHLDEIGNQPDWRP